MPFQTTGTSTNTVSDHVTDFIEGIGYGVNRKKCFNVFGQTQMQYMRLWVLQILPSLLQLFSFKIYRTDSGDGKTGVDNFSFSELSILLRIINTNFLWKTFGYISERAT
jgi:hypothetical protein